MKGDSTGFCRLYLECLWTGGAEYERHGQKLGLDVEEQRIDETWMRDLDERNGCGEEGMVARPDRHEH